MTKWPLGTTQQNAGRFLNFISGKQKIIKESSIFSADQYCTKMMERKPAGRDTITTRGSIKRIHKAVCVGPAVKRNKRK